jgi:hypothetical protein
MKDKGLFLVAAVVSALHIVVLSFVFGLRHTGYILTATTSATLIWGVVFFLNEHRRLGGIIGAVAAGLIVQQVAYQVWKAELPGFWWPLAQFGALQFLMRSGLGRFAS